MFQVAETGLQQLINLLENYQVSGLGEAESEAVLDLLRNLIALLSVEP